jgi:predicted transglutaminase-like cysteine proteinase
MQAYEVKWGRIAGTKFQEITKIINQGKNLPDSRKLEQVNVFFNQNILYASDWTVWGVEDYWATPMECIGKGMGDCEDYAIAKYFALLQMGIPMNKLFISYVKSLKYNCAHMVLTYFETPTSMPLVLDNYEPRILPGNQRTDLIPVYSFNGESLFLAKQTGLGQAAPQGINANKKWVELLGKVKEGGK